MTLKEKREMLLKYCGRTDCKNCLLKQNTWSKVLPNHGCLHIEHSPERDLDIALSLIGESTADNINHPAHYQGANECIDVMVALFGIEAVKDFCKCNAYKYRFRAHAKNGDEDIKKAEWYESKLIELEKAEL